LSLGQKKLQLKWCGKVHYHDAKSTCLVKDFIFSDEYATVNIQKPQVKQAMHITFWLERPEEKKPVDRCRHK